MKKLWKRSSNGRKSRSEKCLQIAALVITCVF